MRGPCMSYVQHDVSAGHGQTYGIAPPSLGLCAVTLYAIRRSALEHYRR